MTLELRPLGTLAMRMQQSALIRDTPAGMRVIVEFSDIRWSGERLNATQRGTAAADWLHVGPEGTAVLDIRFCLETPEGALITVQGGGRTNSATFAQGSPIYFAPTFEASHPQYAWLNRVQAVARGVVQGESVVFDVAEVI
jgi:hypothetical protein